MANDIRDIKNSQAQLSNDVSHCMSLLQQHSASIVRHDELISNCEASIQQLQSAQASILSNISNVESRLTNALKHRQYDHNLTHFTELRFLVNLPRLQGRWTICPGSGSNTELNVSSNTEGESHSVLKDLLGEGVVVVIWSVFTDKYCGVRAIGTSWTIDNVLDALEVDGTDTVLKSHAEGLSPSGEHRPICHIRTTKLGVRKNVFNQW
ncbi:unnamed protein product [Acanthoscelides obtectus]|uniref:Uncharacterized protein n=1 Tax=Acanthoscelides obtectus TaxID=200917 RepID=A0A9P0QA02_ACAOB|nr:unnamed protein product [Acanthoscelides obtectus]CAK1670205.1 hypothetical protein AOBTE_LOCUS27472 [Acanthoscelides obtectus]